MELYAFAYVEQLIRDRMAQPGDGIVVGWDPRDPGGEFTSAVVSGICKAGATALVLGVVPTPLVPMYLLYKKARGGLMVTASHNPKDQNGIKIFSAFRGLKLLPQNDMALTSAVLELNASQLQTLALKGKRVDCRREALELFSRFSLAPENTWIPPGRATRLFRNVTLVVDAANGALSGIAAEIFRQAGFGKVIELNAKLNGDVNLDSGVADLEGKSIITHEMAQKGSGEFSKHRAITKLLELGRKYRQSVNAGKQRICGAIFDADGDRFYRLEYDPSKDALLVLSGDETAFLQAQYLMASDPKMYSKSLYINTIESDLNTEAAAEALGLRPALTAVGDKWILLRIASLIADTRIRKLKKRGGGKTLPAAMLKEWQDIRKNGSLDVLRLRAIEDEIDKMGVENKQNESYPDSMAESFSFAVGSEETGHNITRGYLTREDGEQIPVFLGNGLKSAINTFAATELLLGSKPVKTYFSGLSRPFPPGFKQTLYAYYVRQDLFQQNSPIWDRLKKAIFKEARTLEFQPRIVPFPEEPDMLYIALTHKSGARAAVFVRNSGTENKIGINLRGAKKNAAKLEKIGMHGIRILLSSMKDADNHLYKLELDVLKQVAGGSVPMARLKLNKSSGGRVLAEMAKQDLIKLSAKGYALTPLGKWYSAHH